jgi:hypothetical protein
VSLGACHRTDAEQRVAGRGPRSEPGGVNAGLGHVHPVGRQRVELSQPAPSPCAGRDDGGGRSEDLALARTDRAGLAVRRAVAERHVNEHDLPQPARLGHERFGGGGGDQPVEQDHGAIGNPPDGACQSRVPGLAAPRPTTGHGVLMHRPAELGESSADSAVVCVATARPRRVVDALRDDEVDRAHSSRS